jgi:hypothetical protein
LAARTGGEGCPRRLTPQQISRSRVDQIDYAALRAQIAVTPLDESKEELTSLLPYRNAFSPLGALQSEWMPRYSRIGGSRR